MGAPSSGMEHCCLSLALREEAGRPLQVEVERGGDMSL